MSLTETNLLEVAKKQYFSKFGSYSNLLWALMVVQVLAVLSSLGGNGMSSTGGQGINLQITRYSSSLIVMCTMFWAIISGIICTTTAYKNLDFTYVSSRLSSDISSIGFLLTAGFAAGVMSSLSGVLLRVIIFFTVGSQSIALGYFFPPPQDLLTGILSTTLYVILMSAIGYFVGTLTQVSRGFVILLPLVFIIAVRLPGVGAEIINTFVKESSLLWFAVKVIAATAMLCCGAMLLSNRLEVRR